MCCAAMASPSGSAFADTSPVVNRSDKISMDFDQVDIRVFIKFISEITGKNFIIDERVRGKRITVVSPRGISVDEAYKVFESVLEVHGFTTVPAGDVIKIVRSVEARRMNLPVSVDSDIERDVRDEFITRIIPVEHADIQEIRKIIVPMVSQEGMVANYDPTNLLILIDFQSNINRLLRIIQAIDLPVEGAELNFFELQHSQAAVLARELKQLLDPVSKTGLPAAQQVPLVILPYERLNMLVTLSSKRIHGLIADLISSLDRVTPRGKGNIHVVRLNNALANDLAQVLAGLIGARVSDEITSGEEIIAQETRIVADNATNSLVISATSETFSVIENIIADLDKPRQQVYVEAAIIEVSTDYSFDFGVDWHFSGKSDDTVFLSKINNPPYGTNLDNMARDMLVNTAARPSPLSVGLLSFPFTFQGREFFGLGTFLRASRTENLVNIISTPQLMTLENEEASVVVAENRPFQTSRELTDGREFANFEYRDVGVTLKLTPQINEHGSVKLRIFQEVSRVDTVSTQVADRPVTRKRTAETTVEVQDGKTIVIAGLIEESSSEGETGVPGLSSVPLLGNLFKTTARGEIKRNLMIFITPRIVTDQEGATRIFFNKKRHLESLQYNLEGQIKPVFKDFILAPVL
jgi:general secretion pathway protein D